MDLNTIKMQFGEDCECENDVVKECIIKLKEMSNALRTLGVDTSNCHGLNYVYSYLILKIQDTKEERRLINYEKIKDERNKWKKKIKEKL